MHKNITHLQASGAYAAFANALEQAAICLIPHTHGQLHEVREGLRSAARHTPKQLDALALSLGYSQHQSLVQQHGQQKDQRQGRHNDQQQTHDQQSQNKGQPQNQDKTQQNEQQQEQQQQHQQQAPAIVEYIGWSHAHAQLCPVASILVEPSDAAASLTSAAVVSEAGTKNKGTTKLVSAHLVDSLPAVLTALSAGVDAACMLLRVDSVLASES